MRRTLFFAFLLGFGLGFALTLFLVPSGRGETVRAAPAAAARTLRVWAEHGGVPLHDRPSWTDGRILAVLPNRTRVLWDGQQQQGFIHVSVPALRLDGWVQVFPFEHASAP